MPQGLVGHLTLCCCNTQINRPKIGPKIGPNGHRPSTAANWTRVAKTPNISPHAEVPRQLGCSQRYLHLGPHLRVTEKVGRAPWARSHEGSVWRTIYRSNFVFDEISIRIFEVSCLEFRSIVFRVTIQIEWEPAFETTQEWSGVSHPSFVDQMWLENAPMF